MLIFVKQNLEESIKEKVKAMESSILSQKQKAINESILVEELKLSKELLNKAHQDLETKTNALNSELEKNIK